MVVRFRPITKAANVPGRKRTHELIYYLRERKRFCAPQEIAGGLNPAALTQQPKVLGRTGYVQRYDLSNVPYYFEYDLTEKRERLALSLGCAGEWGRRRSRWWKK